MVAQNVSEDMRISVEPTVAWTFSLAAKFLMLFCNS
jgi:hypothetical protein